MEIKRNIKTKYSTTGTTYELKFINNKYVWVLCRAFDKTYPYLMVDRKIDCFPFDVPFEPEDLYEH